MDSFDIKSYKTTFLKSANELINNIRLNLSTAGENGELRRFFHNLKGQALFMKLDEIGYISLTGQKLIENYINNKMQLDETAKKTLIEIIDKIDLSLKKYESINS